MPTDIVADAMGSDKAPEPEVRGAVLAARQYGVRVWSGRRTSCVPILRQALRGQRLPVFIVPASEWITMDDELAVRTKRDSTMRVGLKMVREGRRRIFYGWKYRRGDGYREWCWGCFRGRRPAGIGQILPWQAHSFAAPGCWGERGLRSDNPRPVCCDGPHVRQRHSQDPQPVRPSLYRGGGSEGQCTDSRYAAAAAR